MAKHRKMPTLDLCKEYTVTVTAGFERVRFTFDVIVMLRPGATPIIHHHEPKMVEKVRLADGESASSLAVSIDETGEVRDDWNPHTGERNETEE